MANDEELSVKPTRYPEWVTPEEQAAFEYRTVMECLARGRKRFFAPYPGVYDREDQESDFLLGVVNGLKKVDWTRGDPIAFLTQNGMWSVRTRRTRAIDKRMVSTCEGCGKELSVDEDACHHADGTPAEVRTGKRDFHDTIKVGRIQRDKDVYVKEQHTETIEDHSDERLARQYFGGTTMQRIMVELKLRTDRARIARVVYAKLMEPDIRQIFAIT